MIKFSTPRFGSAPTKSANTTYYDDGELFIGRYNDRTAKDGILIRGATLYSLSNCYFWTREHEFKIIKELEPGRLILFLAEHGIKVMLTKNHTYTFQDDNDKFLFALKFGAL